MATKRYHRDTEAAFMAQRLANGDYYDKSVECSGCLLIAQPPEREPLVDFLVSTNELDIWERLYPNDAHHALAVEAVHIKHACSTREEPQASEEALAACRTMLEQRYSQPFVTLVKTLSEVPPSSIALPALTALSDQAGALDYAIFKGAALWALRAQLVLANDLDKIETRFFELHDQDDVLRAAIANDETRKVWGYAVEDETATWKAHVSLDKLAALKSYDQTYRESHRFVSPLFEFPRPNAGSPKDIRATFEQRLLDIFKTEDGDTLLALGSLHNPHLDEALPEIDSLKERCAPFEQALADKLLRIRQVHVAG